VDTKTMEFVLKLILFLV